MGLFDFLRRLLSGQAFRFHDHINDLADALGYPFTSHTIELCSMTVDAENQSYRFYVIDMGESYILGVIAKTPTKNLTSDIRARLAQRSQKFSWGDWIISPDSCQLLAHIPAASLDLCTCNTHLHTMIGEVAAFDRRMSGAAQSSRPKIAPTRTSVMKRSPEGRE